MLLTVAVTHTASDVSASSRDERRCIEEDLLRDTQLARREEEAVSKGGAREARLALRLEEAENACASAALPT